MISVGLPVGLRWIALNFEFSVNMNSVFLKHYTWFYQLYAKSHVSSFWPIGKFVEIHAAGPVSIPAASQDSKFSMSHYSLY